jgi:hypothetical protein
MEYYMFLTSSIFPNLPIKHTNIIKHAYNRIPKEVVWFML